jgi:hypothetical protein
MRLEKPRTSCSRATAATSSGYPPARVNWLVGTAREACWVAMTGCRHPTAPFQALRQDID